MLKKPKLVLFDLDGTLVDSSPDLANAVNAALRSINLPEHSEEDVRLWVGNGVKKLMQRAITGDLAGDADEAVYAQAMPVFEQTYAREHANRTCLYPGVLETLQSLQSAGIPAACVTNKAVAFAQPILRTLDIAQYLPHLVGGDSLPEKKPHPMPLTHLAELHGVAVTDTLMVGDSRHDVEAARAAGMDVVAVSYGYNHGESIHSAKPDAVVDDLQELLSLWPT